jgi:omega-6 fatty acid desaturase (delta-12 desaturase)
MHDATTASTRDEGVAPPTEPRQTAPAYRSDAAWLALLASYRQPDRRRSVFELGITIVPFLALWALAWIAVAHGWWAGLLLTVPAAGLLVRLFMIQHDCGHGSFFARRPIDDWTGRVLGVLTLTPYDYWRRTHAVHHASSGNLDARGIGDILTLTVAEYRALSGWGRLRYRLYRHPAVMFGIGPLWVFLVQNRLPLGMMRAGAAPWISVMATNLALALLAAVTIWSGGLVPFLAVELPIIMLGGAAGIWLFYVQHQFEETDWAVAGDWRFPRSALHGSSLYELPPVLAWLTANVGIHHVHHLSSRVPHYRLAEVLRDYPELRRIGRITIPESLRGVRLALWDESRHRLVSFHEARVSYASATAGFLGGETCDLGN